MDQTNLAVKGLNEIDTWNSCITGMLANRIIHVINFVRCQFKVVTKGVTFSTFSLYHFLWRLPGNSFFVV